MWTCIRPFPRLSSSSVKALIQTKAPTPTKQNHSLASSLPCPWPEANKRRIILTILNVKEYTLIRMYYTTERTKPLLLLFEFVPFPGDLSLLRMLPGHWSPSVTIAHAGTAYIAISTQCTCHIAVIKLSTRHHDNQKNANQKQKTSYNVNLYNVSLRRYGDNAANTAENSGIFSIIRMCWLPSRQ